MDPRLEHQLKELDEILEAIEANTSESTMRLARSGRGIIDDIIEEQEMNKEEKNNPAYFGEMPIEVVLKEIKSITPVYVMRAPSHMKVESQITEESATDIIGKIWEWYETDWVQKYFELEGYELKKIEQ